MADEDLDYDELKLRIQREGDGGYRVLASAQDGSRASESFVLPVGDDELAHFLLRMGLPVRRRFSGHTEEARSFGERIFDALFTASVRTIYDNARKSSLVREHRGLRITLQLTDVPELMRIPWEFLYERPHGFLATSTYTPVVRSLESKAIRPARELEPPLRILAMASNPPGTPRLKVTKERNRLDRALGKAVAAGLVEISWLAHGTFRELERRLAEPTQFHVFHYVGHGEYDTYRESGVLAVEDRPQGVSGEDLRMLLDDQHSLQLVVLNSCEGARTSDADPFTGVASSLMECGIPAVVGMQFEISDEAAVIFAERVYGAIADRFPIDAALAQARKAIWAAGCEAEFGTPVLFLRPASRRLFGGAGPGAAGRRGGQADLALRLEERVEKDVAADGAPARVAWELHVHNCGGRELAGVTAKDAGGRALAEPADLAPDGRLVIRWTEAGPASAGQRVTVTASASDGLQISDQVEKAGAGGRQERSGAETKDIEYGRGLRLKDEGDPVAARSELEKSAAGGNAAAAYQLGLLLRDGNDHEGAIRWLAKAAGGDDGGAAFDLGVLLAERGDRAAARHWLEKAAETNPAAAYTLGLRLKDWGDQDGARQWLERGAVGGDVAAAYILGLFLRDRGEIEPAIHWLEVGARGGDPGAARQLGQLLSERDRYRRQREEMDPEAEYQRGIKEHDGGDDHSAQYWLERAADRGNLSAAHLMGVIRRDLDDLEGARHWFDQAAQRGHRDAALELALLLAEAGDRDGARFWMMKYAG